MPTHPPVPAPLRAAQAHPARRLGHETTGSVRHPVASPMSPEGDHFPQARCVRSCVSSPRTAPIPPRCHAWQCIRGGMGDCRHRFAGRGKRGCEIARRCGPAGQALTERRTGEATYLPGSPCVRHRRQEETATRSAVPQEPRRSRPEWRGRRSSLASSSLRGRQSSASCRVGFSPSGFLAGVSRRLPS